MMAKKFKEGDKVRVIREHTRDCMANVKIGGTATILESFDGEHYRVEYERSYGGTNTGYALPKSIELISETTTPKYRTEKRKANVGERILITDAVLTGGYYANGDVGKVAESFSGDIYVKEHPRAILSSEYEVIVEAKPSKNERISLLESQVAELQVKVEALQKRRKPAVALTQTPTIHNVTVNLDSAKSAVDIRKIAEEFAKGLHFDEKPTPNEKRKAVIERAKAFVAEHSDLWFAVEFFVNSDKRTVVALLRSKRRNTVITKAIAKCAPDDVFNADIGKAIALGRALGLDVSEFETAVKPTEAVIGQRVRYAGGRSIRKVTKEYENYATNSAEFVNRKIVDYDIIDDTEAQY